MRNRTFNVFNYRSVNLLNNLKRVYIFSGWGLELFYEAFLSVVTDEVASVVNNTMSLKRRRKKSGGKRSDWTRLRVLYENC